jgi:hypothetical protein
MRLIREAEEWLEVRDQVEAGHYAAQRQALVDAVDAHRPREG